MDGCPASVLPYSEGLRAVDTRNSVRDGVAEPISRYSAGNSDFRLHLWARPDSGTVCATTAQTLAQKEEEGRAYS